MVQPLTPSARNAALPAAWPDLTLLDRLPNALFISDPEQLRILWANAAGLRLWQAATVEAVAARDLSAMSAAVSARYRITAARARLGESVTEQWTLFPADVPVHLVMTTSPFTLADGRPGLLHEGQALDSGVDQHWLRAVEAVRHVGAAILLLDDQGRLLLQNPVAAGLFGLGEGALVELDRLVCDPEVTQAMRNALASGTAAQRRVRLRACDGTPWFMLSVRLLHDPNSARLLSMLEAVDVSELVKAELTVRASEERFERLLKLSSDWYWETDAQHCLIFFSDGFPQLALGDTASMLGVPRWQIPNLESPEFWLAHRGALQRREPFAGLRIRRMNVEGGMVFVSISGEPMFDERGNFKGYRGIAQDVTRHEVNEERLRQSEARFRALFEAAPVPMLLSRASDGTIKAVNRNMVQATNIAPERLIGQKTTGFYPERDRQLLVQRLSTEGQVRNFETVATLDQGEQTVLLSVATLEVDGEPCYLTGTLNITELKRDQRMRESEQAALEMIVRGAPLPDLLEHICHLIEQRCPGALCACSLLRDGKLCDAAGSSLAAEFRGALDGMAIGPDAGACGSAAFCGEAIITEEIETSPLWTSILPLAQSHGLRSCWALPISAVQGDTLGVLAIYHRAPCLPSADELAVARRGANLAAIAIERMRSEQRIHELNAGLEQRVRERTDQLEAINQELEAFAYSVSHDLRAPLRAIDGFSRALVEDCSAQLNENGRSHVQRVREAAQRMSMLIDDLLALSRLSRAEMRIAYVDLSGLAREICAELQATAPQRVVTFVISPLLAARADHGLARIVLENLLDNAWKYTSKNPTAKIEFGSVIEGGKHVFFVRDDGVGFDMGYAGKLFGAFQRMHHQRDFPGSGIGLATVHRIVRRHGGEVWADARLDQGATFFFTFR